MLLVGVLLLLMVDGCFRFTVTTHAKTMFAPVVSFCWWLVVMHLLFFIDKWNDVGQEAFSFLESFIYKGSYDGCIRTGLRCGHSVIDVLNHADVKEQWEKILDNKADVQEDEKKGNSLDNDDSDSHLS